MSDITPNIKPGEEYAPSKTVKKIGAGRIAPKGEPCDSPLSASLAPNGWSDYSCLE